MNFYRPVCGALLLFASVGCGEESVWELTLSYPTTTLSDWTAEDNFTEDVVVTDISDEGAPWTEAYDYDTDTTARLITTSRSEAWLEVGNLTLVGELSDGAWTFTRTMHTYEEDLLDHASGYVQGSTSERDITFTYVLEFDGDTVSGTRTQEEFGTFLSVESDVWTKGQDQLPYGSMLDPYWSTTQNNYVFPINDPDESDCEDEICHAGLVGHVIWEGDVEGARLSVETEGGSGE